MRQKVADVKSVHFPSFSWVHDFPATQNWAVVPQTPCVWNMGVSMLSAVEYDLHFAVTVQRPCLNSSSSNVAAGSSGLQQGPVCHV